MPDSDAPAPPPGEARIHELKSIPPFFQAVLDGTKTFEVRREDRGFNLSDTLWLREFDHDTGYSGRELRVSVRYLSSFHQQPGYVVLGIERGLTVARDAPSEEGIEAVAQGLHEAADRFSDWEGSWTDGPEAKREWYRARAGELVRAYLAASRPGEPTP